MQITFDLEGISDRTGLPSSVIQNEFETGKLKRFVHSKEYYTATSQEIAYWLQYWNVNGGLNSKARKFLDELTVINESPFESILRPNYETQM